MNLWLIAVAAGALLLQLPYLWPGGPGTHGYQPLLTPNRDEGTVLYDALRIAQGEVMYRDFFEFQGPVFYHLFAALLALTGPSVVAARLLNLVIVAAGAGCLAALVGRSLGRLAGVGAAAIHAAVLVPMFPNAYPHWLALALVLGALVLVGRDRTSARHELAAGVLLGLAVATIQSLGVPALAAVAGGLLLPGLAARQGRQALAARGQSLPSPKRAEPARLLRCSSVKYEEYSPSSRLAAGPAAPISARSDFVHGLLVAPARVLAGAAAVLAVIALVFAARGALGAMVHAMFVWPFSHYGAGQQQGMTYGDLAYVYADWHERVGEPWRSLGLLHLRVIHDLPFLALGGAVAAAVVAAIRLKRRESRFGDVVVAIASLAAVSPLLVGGTRRDLIHIAFLAAFGLCGGAVLLATILRARHRRLAPIAFCVLGALALTSHLHKTQATWTASRKHATFADAFFARIPAARVMAEHSASSDEVVVGWFGGWACWFTGRRTPVAYTLLPEVPEDYAGYFTDDMWQRTADTVAQRAPRVLLLEDGQWRRLTRASPALAALYVPRLHPRLLWRRE